MRDAHLSGLRGCDGEMCIRDRFPGTPYIIFPGNVGEVSTLREAVEILLG